MVLPATYRLKNQWSFSMVGGGGTPANGIGTASEFNIEGLERDMDNERRPGAAGSINYGGDFNEVSATITLISITDSLRSAIYESVCSNVTINLSAVFENIRDNCDVAVLTASLRGIIGKYPLGWQLSNDTAETELMIGVNYYSEVWKGKTFIYSPDEMVWSWAGTNLWQARQSALGI